MLLSEFKSSGKSLIKLWIVLFCIQLLFFIVSSIVVSQTEIHTARSWLWEYLTLTKGNYSLAWTWIVCNGLITVIDFYASNRVQRENLRMLWKTHSNKENTILRKMYRNLKFSMTLIIVAFFIQMVHGLVWWILGIGAIVCKVFYLRELTYLDPNLFPIKFPYKRW